MRYWIITSCLLFAAILPAAAARYVIATAPPAHIHETVRDATIQFEAERSVIWFRQGCVETSWQAEGIQAIFINGIATTGIDNKRVCVEPLQMPWLRVIIDENTVHNAYLDIVILSETTIFLVSFAIAVCLLITGIALMPPVTARLQHIENGEHIVVFCLILAMGIGLRLVNLNREVYADEAFTFVNYVLQPVSGIIRDYSQPNNHMLHSVLSRWAMLWLGDAPWVLRLPAFTAGVLVMLLTYALGRQIYNKSVALLAMGLIAVNPMLIVFSVNGRGYSLVVMFFLMLLLLANRRHIGWWLLFAVIAALGFFTIPTFLYAMAVVVIVVLLRFWLLKQWQLMAKCIGAVVLGALLTLLLYLPLFRTSGIEALTQNPYSVPQPLSQVVQEIIPAIVQQMLRIPVQGFPILIVGLLYIGVIITLLKHRELGKTLPILPLAAIVVLMMVVLLRRSGFARTWLFLSPIYLITAAVGLDWLMRRRASNLRTLLITIGLAVFIGSSDVLAAVDGTGQAPGIRKTAREFKAMTNSNYDLQIYVILHPNAEFPLQYYTSLYRITPPPATLNPFWDTYPNTINKVMTDSDVRLFTLSSPITDVRKTLFYNVDSAVLPDPIPQEMLSTFDDRWELTELFR